MTVQRPANVGRFPAVRRSALLLLLSGLALGLSPAPQALAETVQAGRSEIGGPYAADIAEAAQRFGIPVAWIVAVLGAESSGDPVAVSSVGAMGLMQLMPATWEEQRALHRLGGDPFQPRDNIVAGTAYLRAMWDRYRTIGGMLAAYNAGPGRYDEYLAGVRELPRETREYVAALVPLLGGEPLAPAALAGAPRVTDWRDSPLFVTAQGGSESAFGRHDERSGSAPSDAPAASPASLAPAPAEALFVASALGRRAVSGIARFRAVAECRKGKEGARAGRGTATGIRQGKSACVNHRQAIGMAWCFAHMAVGRAYAWAILPAKSKSLRMGGCAVPLRRRA